mgnify:CR=1 FL=1|jgi:hypothetical protein
MRDFRKLLNDIREETAAADIATVDTKLDTVKRPKHLEKGKKCKKHKTLNCETCQEELFSVV